MSTKAPTKNPLIKGVGPDLLTLDGATISIGQVVYVVQGSGYGDDRLPKVGKVAALDLNNRTARIQIIGQSELNYWADSARRPNNYGYSASVYATVKGAREASLAKFKAALDAQVEEVAKEQARLAEKKAQYNAAAKWKPSPVPVASVSDTR